MRTLDDDVDPTDAAKAAAPAVLKQFKASQIAAFLALHADQVVDPLEVLDSALDAIRDTRSEGGATAAAEINTMTADTAASVSYLVCGSDAARAKTLAGQITSWLKAGSELSDKDFTAMETAREETAKKLLGDPDPIAVLSHWLDLQVAMLLSNPELPAAIDATLAAHAAAK